ncbi:hypothetical protein M8044_000001 [Columbia Basin potato purple top phytoplasma]|uniref:Uncharacterized protein n=1 Tax=Columbia Basin potato purple top phytoplasma TaxID=307134 RepID=A0ABT5L872_9MOLU|nr:hypothetical protein [Columbia Basin potato purple top phytoplasma]
MIKFFKYLIFLYVFIEIKKDQFIGSFFNKLMTLLNSRLL